MILNEILTYEDSIKSFTQKQNDRYPLTHWFNNLPSRRLGWSSSSLAWTSFEFDWIVPFALLKICSI